MFTSALPRLRSFVGFIRRGKLRMTHNRADGIESLLLQVEVTGEVEGKGTRFARSENHALELRTHRAVRKNSYSASAPPSFIPKSLETSSKVIPISSRFSLNDSPISFKITPLFILIITFNKPCSVP